MVLSIIHTNAILFVKENSAKNTLTISRGKDKMFPCFISAESGFYEPNQIQYMSTLC